MIDVHSHYFPSSMLKEIAGHESGLGVSYTPDEGILTFPGGPRRPIPASLTDLAGRRELNRSLGISRQVLSPWLDVAGDDLKGSQAIAWARLYNDSLAQEVDGDPNFPLFATIPVGHSNGSAEELRRAVADLGFAGGTLPTHVTGTNLDEAGLDPLFEAAQDLGVPLFLHPYRVMAEDRMSKDFLTNICGNPFEVTLAAVTLFFAGVPERYPRLDILLAHCGGTLPLIAGRVARGSQKASGVRKKLEAPDDILGCYYYDTLMHDPDALAFSIRRIGADRCAAGSDIPFPMSVDDPAAHIREALETAGLSESFERVTRGTATEILKLGPSLEQ
ncbi:MAG: amidohydrolase family protein [Actinobacteria bacterium]|nr:amidohydrolase family protein [Actinomycetota bacterium]